MTHPGIHCAREQKNEKILANKQTFHGHSSFVVVLPLEKTKFFHKFSPHSLSSAYSNIYTDMCIYNNKWVMLMSNINQIHGHICH